jgi:hypothetical protein
MNKISDSIENIARNIEKLGGKKNINEITKLYSDVNTKIDETRARLLDIRRSFESREKKICDITDEEYEEIMLNLSKDIDSINKKDVETQVTEHIKLESQIESCIHYLKNKKMVLVECDKLEEKIEDPQVKSNSVVETEKKPRKKSTKT